MNEATASASGLSLSQQVIESLVCPCRAHARLRLDKGAFVCTESGCGKRFPILNGIPVLIDEQESVFAIADYERGAATTSEDFLRGYQGAGRSASLPKPSILRRLRNRLGNFPKISRSISPWKSMDELIAALTAGRADSKILVLGCGDLRIPSPPGCEIVYTDVTFGPLAQMIADCHGLPFADDSFDAAIAMAMLQHVADPYRCVDEIHRVLKPKGQVWSITAFIQQVCMGAYDFTRFTHLGHRRLFRGFEELKSGANCGPGMALAWSFENFLASFSERIWLRRLLRTAARCLTFYLVYFDDYLVKKRGAFDCASSYYFLGRKSDKILSDRELVGLFRGQNPR
ncbi:MAG: methyltransferase domain-containing protein [Proteobacteria bacterium]|nr:methyltransferase domain-containing protein [Pseudomonadota bacterium]